MQEIVPERTYYLEVLDEDLLMYHAQPLLFGPEAFEPSSHKSNALVPKLDVKSASRSNSIRSAIT